MRPVPDLYPAWRRRVALSESAVLRQLHAMPLPEAECTATIVRAGGAAGRLLRTDGKAATGAPGRRAGRVSGGDAALAARLSPRAAPRTRIGTGTAGRTGVAEAGPAARKGMGRA